MKINTLDGEDQIARYEDDEWVKKQMRGEVALASRPGPKSAAQAPAPP